MKYYIDKTEVDYEEFIQCKKGQTRLHHQCIIEHRLNKYRRILPNQQLYEVITEKELFGEE